MEDNIRRNTKVQSALHELPHGDKSSKSRFEFISISLFMLSATFFFLQKHHIAYFLWITSACIALFISKNSKIESETKNERSNERKTEFIPAYGVDRTRMLVMLRNIETEKRKHV